MFSNTMNDDVQFHIVGDAYVDFFCFLGGEWPENGGDSRLNQPVRCYAGGSSTNTATHLKALLKYFDDGNRSSVKLHTVLNPLDHYGQILLDHVKEHDLELHNCWQETDSSLVPSTGHCIAIISGGERSFMTHQGVVESFDASHIQLEEMISSPNHLHLHIAGFYNIPGFWNGKLAEKLRLLRQQRRDYSTTISLVTQHDATKIWDGGLTELIPLLDFVIMNDLEAHSIVKAGGLNVDNYEHEHLCWAEYFGAISTTTNVIVTRGEKGAICLRDKQITAKQKPIVVHAIDPTGAGDSFTAGFIHGLWSWRRHHHHHHHNNNDTEAWPMLAIEEGMRWGVSVGSAAVLIRGASIPPDGNDIQSFLQQAKEPEHPGSMNGYTSV
jgi:sugar/nucleoside kinase (ribokinase family)